MKIIYRYLIKKFIGPFILTFFFALIILLMQFLWLYVDELVGKGLEIHLILELLLYASATFVATAVPLAILLSSLMTFGALGEHYELVALKSAGIPISKLMIPLACFSIFLGGVSFWFNNNVSPKAYIKMRTLLFDIREQKPALSIEEGTFYDGFDNYVIRIGKKHRDNETIEDILIYDHSRHNGNTTMTYAQRGNMKITPDGRYMLFYLYDGSYWDESHNQGGVESSYPLTRAKFKEQYKRFDLSSFELQKTEDSYYNSNTKALSNQQLSSQIDTIKKQIHAISDNAVNNYFTHMYYFTHYLKEDSSVHYQASYSIDEIWAVEPQYQQTEILRYAGQTSANISNAVKFTYEEADYKNATLWSHEIEWHRKFTLAVACLLFFFIGSSLGSIIRKGGIGIPLLVTVFFFTFYFAFSVMGEKISKGNVFPVSVGMWLSSIILVPICIFLTKKATRDSAVFSWDEYGKWFKKIKIKFSRKRNEDPSNMS